MKKPLYKKWWFWVFLFLLIGFIGSFMEKKDEDKDLVASTQPAAKADKSEATKPPAAPDPEPKPESKPKPAAKDAVVEKSDDKPIPGTIGMTAKEFQTAFNKASDEFGALYSIDNLKVETGPAQDTFKLQISDLIFMNGSINKKDGSVREVTIIGGVDGTPESVTDLMLSIGTLIAATNPSLEAKQRGAILKDVGLTDEATDFSDHKASTSINKIKYTLNSSTELGIWFTASDAKEK
ncbi:hypothetical protein K0T92_06610 [Paenibacillus oenotherae]|uniref:Uncharacterized protein n=1 Tax=Paenibacillus oenotherae TaxID=1435645 RepID=A0ABS7D4J9_9BACL|nr:hypothetical protein [Paenibacillus oenotherae]MBW7474411.1 hypothetical protein [Paenibacillus oenotherae]